MRQGEDGNSKSSFSDGNLVKVKLRYEVILMSMQISDFSFSLSSPLPVSMLLMSLVVCLLLGNICEK